MLMDCLIWPGMFGNGAAIGTGLTIIKHWPGIRFLIIPKDLIIHWIPQNLKKKRRSSVVVRFYVRINIAPDIWWEAEVKGNIDLLRIMLASGVLKLHHNAIAG